MPYSQDFQQLQEDTPIFGLKAPVLASPIVQLSPQSLVVPKTRRRVLARLRTLAHRHPQVVVACGVIPAVATTIAALVSRLQQGREAVLLLQTLAEDIDELAEALCLDIYTELAPELLRLINVSKSALRRDLSLQVATRELSFSGPRITSRLVARWMEEQELKARFVDGSCIGFYGVPATAKCLKPTTRWGRSLRRSLRSHANGFLVTQQRVEALNAAHNLAGSAA